MSAPDQACRKFQANFFNRSKCQNCFKARDSHPVSDRDRSQAKPIYGGWLLLAPEGISFDNPGQRSRKWQRRFFILYEHGLLCYALDEMPSTLPQGSINMNQSTDVLEGESTTAHKYSLCILTPEKQHFIRAENRETINGWFETLIVYPRANKQNPKKKRKVESPPAQEPGPAKIAVTQCHIPGVEKIPSQKSTLWQKELPETRNHPQHCPQGPAPMAVFPRTPALDEGSGTKETFGTASTSHRGGQHRNDCCSLEKLPATYKPLGSLPGTGTFSRYSCPESGSVAACSPQLSCHPFPPTDRNLSISSSQSSLGSDTSSSSLSSASPLDTLGPGLETRHTDYVTLADIPRVKRNSHREAFRAERQARARSPGREEVIRLFGYERRKSQVIEQFEALQMEASSPGDTKINNETRQGRSETRNFSRKRECVSESGNLSSVHPPLCSRAMSLDRRVTECAVTPDLLNFKKGWMSKLSEEGQWKKHWFVLTDRFLRFYRDSVAEEAVDLDGEVDLNGCSEATECEVQRNYGFQINTQAGVCVLSAMTSGIRNSWIQAIMKNVRPVTMPDVASHVSEEKQKARTLFEGSFRMKTKAETGTCVETESKRSRTRERRREGRSKTLDWAEFCRDTKVDLDLSNSSATEPDPRELERDRARRREERRRRFETAEDSHSLHDEPLMKLEVDGSIRTPKAARPENVSVEIEQRWHQVESARLCEENQVPIPIHSTQANGQERLPAQEPQALSTELEQAQRELRNLNEQNRQLQGQLQVSREQTQAARDGYVLQTKVTSPPRSLETHQSANPHLPIEFGAECEKQALNHDREETRGLIHIHKGSDNGEPTTEQQLAKWQQQSTVEWEQERTLNLQLRESEERLEAEVLFLEKTQALWELERQQISQRGDMQTLQYSRQLHASEQGILNEEEMFQKHYEIFKQNYVKEKAIQIQTLRRGEESLEQYENCLGDFKEQLDDLQRGKPRNSLQGSQMSQLLEEQDITVQILSQSLMQCEKEQLVEKVMNKATKRQDQPAEILMVKNSHKQLTQQLQVAHKLLDEKSRELNEVKDVYENLIKKKDRMLNEAMIKLYALGNSLEETEKQLQAQTSLLQQLSPQDASTHTLNQQDNLQNKLSTAEKQISELKQQLDMLQLENEELELKNTRMGSLQQYEASQESELKAELTSTEPDLILSGVDNGVTGGESDSAFPKWQRIRFSRIQCHKYRAGDGTGKLLGLGLASDISQGRSLSVDEVLSAPLYAASSAGSEAGKELLSSDEKLKAATLILEKEADQDVPNPKRMKPEAQLQEQLQESVFTADSVNIRLEVEKAKRWKLIQDLNGHLGAIELQYGQVCSLMETCDHNVQVLLRESNKASSVHLHTLLEVQSSLANAIHCLEKVRRSLEQQHMELQDAHEQIHNGLSDRAMLLRGQFLLAREREVFQQQEASDQDKVKLFADKLAFEALILNKMAQTLQSEASDSTGLGGLCEEFEVFVSEADNVADGTSEPCSTVDFAEILLKKIISEGEFWIEVEKLRKNIRPEEDKDKKEECDAVLIDAFASKVAQSASLKAELTLAVQKVAEFFRLKVQNLEQEIQTARQEIREKDKILSEVLDPSKSPAHSEFVQLLKEVPERKMFNIRHPELILAQIEREEARNPTLNVVEKHLNDISGKKQEECDFSARAELSDQLKERANILQQLAEGLQSLSQGETEKIRQKLLEVSQVLSSYVYMKNINNYASVLVQEAGIQAQISYIVCKIQTDYKEEHKRYKDLCSDMDALCQKHAKNIASIQLKYEEVLHKEWQGYSEALATLEKENEALKHQNSCLDAELALKQTLLQDMEKKHQDSLQQVQAEHELELKLIHKNLEGLETADQNTLGVAPREAESPKNCQQTKIKDLEECFHNKMQELSRVREDENHLHAQYEQRVRALENALEYKRENSESLFQQSFLRKRSSGTKEDTGPRRRQLLGDVGQAEGRFHLDSMTVLQERIEDLETQMNLMRDELEQKGLEENAADLKEKKQKDFDNLKATCERAFAAMEESHHKVLEDLQRRHQRERETLEREKQQLLAEETAATIAAIEAMKNAHREELEREQGKTQRSQISGMNSDTEALHKQHMEEIESVQRELEVLSEQYSHKCLENAHLAQALEAERQALQQCQRENQELNTHNQDLNKRLAAEFARLRELVTGEGRGDGAGSPSSQGKDGYELEVLLRVKESEIQYLKQEISSVKDELHTALRDKKYSTDKYKDIYTELSIVRAKADCDINRLREQLKEATEALCGGSGHVPVYDIMKSKSNPDFLKRERPQYSRPLRTLRSKSLKEGLTIQERMKLFESKDSRKL
uniref:Myosin phosphatase Rho interacting protein n=1 Tax=Callorhinchus milii TaxID=7868 RepID=A0A4W3H6X3_CALMI|eukprot:gi/632952200/ref/XP_007891723.1/ PREDICTED: myosin phosphatase Rho-interacting protein isoform X1 [Callorhinchus milii]